MAAGETADPRVVEPGEVLWRGMPVALHAPGEARPFDLAPDGRSFLYLQGAPWPRVMLQELPARPGGAVPEPVVLGTAPPFGARPPRFDHGGRHAFFTAELDPGAEAARRVQAPPKAAAPPEPLRLAVVRASVRGLAMERLLPAPGAERGELAVLLDVHPGGHTLLAGTGRDLEPHQLPAGGAALELFELTFRDTGEPIVPPRPLHFQVSFDALVRYSWDGTAIYYGTGPRDGDPTPVQRYLRASGLHEPTGLDQNQAGRLGGDVEVYLRETPHPGSFGWDGFPQVLLAREPQGPAAPLSVPDGILSPLPLIPVSVRGGRMLLAGGLRDRLELALARWDPARFEAALAAAALSPHPLAVLGPAPGQPELPILARAADTRTAELLRRMQSSLAFLPGAPVRSLRARWTQRTLRQDLKSERTVEVTELATGEIRIERSQPPLAEGAPPGREVEVWNQKEAWVVDARGVTTPLPAAAVFYEKAVASPFRLLLDPAGLGSPSLSFAGAGEAAEPLPGGGERRLVRLEARALDGFRAELWVERSEGRVLPVRIDSALLFPEDKMRRGMGAIPEKRSVAFEDYRPAGGRFVPGRIRFDDGMNPFELVLDGLDYNLPEVEKVFEK